MVALLFKPQALVPTPCWRASFVWFAKHKAANQRWPNWPTRFRRFLFPWWLPSHFCRRDLVCVWPSSESELHVSGHDDGADNRLPVCPWFSHAVFVTVGVGKAAEMGILIRDADVLQSASRINTVVFDKTGTLTQGAPSVQQLFAFNHNSSSLLSLLLSAEQQSEHPLAKAIVNYAKTQQATAQTLEQFENLRGKGVRAVVAGQTLHIASVTHLQSLEVDFSQAQEALNTCQYKAWTTVAVALDCQLIGLVAISDPSNPMPPTRLPR